MGRRYPDGIKDFKALVNGDYYFVDKTMMIAEVCRSEDQTFLYTRPRRFGKSINLSMLDYYFNMKYKDDTDIFKGLKIDSCDQCKQYRSHYPIIRMDFSDFDSTSVETFRESLKSMISSVAVEASSLLSDTQVSDRDLEIVCDAS